MVLQNLDNIYTLYKIEINIDYFKLPQVEPKNKNFKNDASTKELNTFEESCLKIYIDQKSLKNSITEFSNYD